MLLSDFLQLSSYDTVINIVYNNNIVRSFRTHDFFMKTGEIIYNSEVKAFTASYNAINVYVEDERYSNNKFVKKSGIPLKIISYEDGSFLIDDKPFKNVEELTFYLKKRNY